ncbi:hypothetical protein JRQ81_017549 [Phrynocephalus forsythii]|uniref:Laccase domain-containing protein 1 n=1 Tax=Phrynocephalus forsythii TaxID=171643 RepID=A0A9Q0XR31_9SAUR|nr:hypothetical protein JRQ81_017549 [Phrynocephalus forsythii]
MKGKKCGSQRRADRVDHKVPDIFGYCAYVYIMAKAVLIDLCSSWSGQTPESVARTLEAVQEEDHFHTRFVYIMCYHAIKNERYERNGEDAHHKIIQSFHCPEKGVAVVCSPSIVAALYTVKQKLDEKGIDTIKIILPSKRKPSLREYVNRLFTSVYQIEFKDLQINGEEYNPENPTVLQSELAKLTDRDVQEVESEIALFLKCLPSLKGKLTILKSFLIPDHIFLHGFTTRTGGISYIPTLSSFNLFSSSKRRDPPAVVKENLRRLAAAAGFNQDKYHTIKVNHASDVWVMGKAQPKSFDALVTNQKGVTIAAPGADCIPVLFADPVRKACGAAHSGWLGTLLGVSMAVVDAMIKEYGSNVKDILVVLGTFCWALLFQAPTGIC